MDWQKDSLQLKEAFNRDGYVVLRSFFTNAEAEALNAHINRYITEVLPQLPSDAAFYEIKGQPDTIMRLQNMADHDNYFKELNCSEDFVRLAGLLLDDAVVNKNMQWFTKPARIGKETPPHQDGFYYMLEPNEALTLWLALDTVNDTNGCVRYVRGSHRRGIRPHRQSNVLGFSQGITDYGEGDDKAEMPIHVVPGDLIAHHCMTIHRADANPTDKPRRALGFVYYAQRAEADAGRQQVYKKELMERWLKEGKI